METKASFVVCPLFVFHNVTFCGRDAREWNAHKSLLWKVRLRVTDSEEKQEDAESKNRLES